MVDVVYVNIRVQSCNNSSKSQKYLIKKDINLNYENSALKCSLILFSRKLLISCRNDYTILAIK